MSTISTTPANIAAYVHHRTAKFVTAVVVMFALLAPPSPVTASTDQPGNRSETDAMQPAGFPERDEDREIRVYDKADILTDAQEESMENDLDRANGAGVEVLVYTRISDDSREDSQVFADQLRAEWGVESGVGDDDGLVYLVSVGSAASEMDSIVVSTGGNTFPIRQLDKATFEGIFDNEVTPQIEDGEFNRALLFGIRRVLNFAEYSPPDPSPLTPVQDHFRLAAAILAAGLLQLAVIGYFLVPALRERRLSFVPATRSLAIYATVLGALGVGTGIVAIAGRSTFGSLTSLGVVIWAGCIVPLLIGYRSRRREQSAADHPAIARQSAIGPLNV